MSDLDDVFNNSSYSVENTNKQLLEQMLGTEDCDDDTGNCAKYSDDGKTLIKFSGEDYYHIQKGTVEIAERACAGAKTYKINIPESVEKIGVNAFFRSEITDMVIPASVKYIDKCAFQGCSELENIEILGNIEEIKSHTFFRCNSLKIMVVPEGVTLIGESAFESCSGLQELYLPSTLHTLEYQAFAYCSKLMDIRCAAVTPPRFPEDKSGENYCFIGINKDVRLYVPKQSIPLYKANSTWNKFIILPWE